MTKKKRILITKVLSQELRDRLSDFDIVEEALIAISYNKHTGLPEKTPNAIFTSKNSVFSLKEALLNKRISFDRVFCVGEQTERLLSQYGIDHTVRANSAEELAYMIIDEKIELADFFCGNLRREELPVILEEHGISVTEHIVYNTEFTPVRFKEHFDAILFFSPSGVLSYFSEQNSREPVAFCIGNTTAVEAIDYFEQVHAAEEPSAESLVATLIEYYKNE